MVDTGRRSLERIFQYYREGYTLANAISAAALTTEALARAQEQWLRYCTDKFTDGI